MPETLHVLPEMLNGLHDTLYGSQETLNGLHETIHDSNETLYGLHETLNDLHENFLAQKLHAFLILLVELFRICIILNIERWRKSQRYTL